MISAMLPLHFFWSEARHGRNRWSLCAKEVCFRNELLRCVPPGAEPWPHAHISVSSTKSDVDGKQQPLQIQGRITGTHVCASGLS